MRERNIATSGEYFVFKPECRTFVVQHRGVEQLVARWAHNPKATGSSPVPATTKTPTQRSGVFYFQKVCQQHLKQVL